MALANEATFEYTCLKYDPPSGVLRFDEAPDFDTAREPTVGKMLTICSVGEATQSKSSAIWHHKWMWVLDDYSGFDVGESYAWSKKWIGVLTEAAKGSLKSWAEQLQAHRL